MKALGFIAYWVLAITQFLGIYTYFSNVQDWNGFVSVIIALILGGIPILGTIFGVLGATQGWGWGLIPALCLYLWPFIIFGIVYLFSKK
ncbi:hypothetical protein MMO38_06710 [Acinetobacter sp. NIPH 1852]|uniref:hypothetical protein n=1 Tax=Acinetobacter sp. NIPH 1852 TaxID=2923428 RepID=UPI001F4A65AF|nr:hypothetical protein [Acinetobacter sp. NIPH 1852]MCH7307831.1 hypothetical protein [Acinetobacter sp. NIPH 1852]